MANYSYEALRKQEPILDKVPIFNSVAPARRETLMSCARVITLARGETLFHQGEPAEGFFILVRGRTKIRKISSTGNEVVLHLATPPQMIGCKALTTPGSSYPADAIALEPSLVLRFSRDRFLRAVSEEPDVFFNLLVDLNRRLSEIYSLQASLLEPVEQRIAILLLRQALPEDAEPEDWQDHPLFEVRLTKSVIGAIVGTTTETAIRILSRWRKQGLIASERGRLRLLKPGLIYDLTFGSEAMPKVFVV